MKKIKKAISCMLAMLMLLSSMTVFALNASANISSGQCGDNVTWSLSEDKVLTISGEGEMYESLYTSPWRELNVETVIIEDGVTSISQHAFYYCTSITSVEIPDSVTSIGDSAFSNCTSLTSIDIPDGVASISNLAFSSCKSLVSVTIPDSVTTIVTCAFSDCVSLEAITIPDSITDIGSHAFYNCRSLKSLILPCNIKYIGKGAFRDCDSLTTVIIPDSAVLGDYAFSWCISLSDIYYTGSEKQWNEMIAGCDFATMTNTKIHYNYGKVTGDINGDGRVNAKDSNMMKRIIMGSFAADEALLDAADLNGDGHVNTKDLYIMKKLLIQ